MKLEHKRLHRHILEAIEAQSLTTEKVDLYKMDMTTSQALDQLRQANYVKGIFHDIIHAPIMIEGMPIITVEGQKYLDELRSARWKMMGKLTWGTIVLFDTIIAAICSSLQVLHSCSSAPVVTTHQEKPISDSKHQ
jgi:hypothetical protein